MESRASPNPTDDFLGRYILRLVASNKDGEDQDSLTVQVEQTLPTICRAVREFNSAYFDRGSSRISSAAEKKLRENVDVLRKCPNLPVRVEGFAAPGEPNGQVLSEARAQAVTDFYEAEGIGSGRIQTSGEGILGDAAGKKGDASRFRRVDTIPLSGGAGGAQPEE
jgi:outer membrane protein OmpA-like peptidoglycan-associated protein